MSLTKTIERLEAEKTDLEAKMEEAKTAKDEALTSLAAAQDQHKSEIERVETERQTEREESALVIAGLQKDVMERDTAMQAQTEDLTNVRDELEKTKVHLANPALKDVSDGGESVDETAGEESAPKTMWDEYNAIDDPVEQAQFMKANRRKLKMELKKALQG